MWCCDTGCRGGQEGGRRAANPHRARPGWLTKIQDPPQAAGLVRFKQGHELLVVLGADHYRVTVEHEILRRSTLGDTLAWNAGDRDRHPAHGSFSLVGRGRGVREPDERPDQIRHREEADAECGRQTVRHDELGFHATGAPSLVEPADRPGRVAARTGHFEKRDEGGGHGRLRRGRSLPRQALVCPASSASSCRCHFVFKYSSSASFVAVSR